MAQVRVVLADDDPGMSTALAEILVADDRFEVLASAADGHELLDRVQELTPDVVLLDVRMPGGGAVAMRALSALPRPPRVVVVSATADRATVTSLVREGAVGYLVKGRLDESLPDLVIRCAAGEMHLAVPHARQIIDGLICAGH